MESTSAEIRFKQTTKEDPHAATWEEGQWSKEMEPCLRTTSINYIFFFICSPSHNFVFSCDVNIGADLRTIEMH